MRTRALVMPLRRHDVVFIIDGSARSTALREAEVNSIAHALDAVVQSVLVDGAFADATITVLSADLFEDGVPRQRPDIPGVTCEDWYPSRQALVTELDLVDPGVAAVVRCLAPSRSLGPARPFEVLARYLGRSEVRREGAELNVVVLSASSEEIPAEVIEQLRGERNWMVSLVVPTALSGGLEQAMALADLVPVVTYAGRGAGHGAVLDIGRQLLIDFFHFDEPLLADGACEVFERPGRFARPHRCDELPGRERIGGSVETGGEHCRLARDVEFEPQWHRVTPLLDVHPVTLEYVWPGMIIELRCPLPDYACPRSGG